MSKHVLLLGAGHAHLTVLKRLPEFIDKGHQVTVVSLDDYHYYSGMGPGMLGGFYAPEQIRFNVRKLTERGGGVFFSDRVVKIAYRERKAVLASGVTIEYDVVSCNLGSLVDDAGMQKVEAGARVLPVKPIDNLMTGRRIVLGLVHQGHGRVLVVGGGPAAAETAGNVWRAARQCVQAKGGKAPGITILAGSGFMHRYPKKVAGLARESLEERGIEILENGHAREIQPGRVILENGEIYEADLILLATGTKPPGVFADSGLPVGPGGGLLVDEFLRCGEVPEIFGGGDCIHFEPSPLDRVGVHAVRENPVLHANLTAALEDEQLQPFEPQAKYMLIMNMGDGTGVLWRGDFACRNRPAFRLKNWIDKRFVGKFQ